MRGIQRKFIESGLLVLLLISLFVLASAPAAGQQPAATPATDNVISKNTPAETKQPVQPAAAVVAPVYKDFMGVTLGMAADDIRSKLGHLKNKSDRQDFFVFSETQTAQIVYDEKGHATIISVDYLSKDGNAPSPESVLGEPAQAKPDGSIYQRKRYPEAGYWIAYSRTAGDNPVITVTMQKI
ncbi:MAG TPA: hypothetical protein VJV03_00520 [Pyrinomonadaceae bacterium]|nr:hypothetical protein [Pyrinomonadaceae bacterium]